MDIIKTGLGIKRTIKNAARAREIITVFARNGFSEILAQSGVLSWLPGFVLPKSQEKLADGDVSDFPGVMGFRIRKSFEQLGPAFVKLGQLLSTREDIFPPSFIHQMKFLRDKVEGVDYDAVIASIEKSYGRNFTEIFSEIEREPVGTASIGVVHKGKLLNGDVVVIKVRRPNIKKNIETDFEIFQVLVEAIERVSHDIQYLGLSKLVHDFEISLKNELNFKIESRNGRKIAENIKKYEGHELYHIPKIYNELVSEDVLVMEYLDGIPFSDLEKIRPHLAELEVQLEKSLRIFVKTLLKDGFFHADLHGGNFFYLTETKKIGIIDFGLVGSMSKKSRGNFVAIIYSLLNQNYENLVYEFLDVAEYEKIPDVDALVRDLKDNVSPFVGLSAQSIDYPLLIRTVIATLSNHRLFLPRDWYIIFRALATLDGVGKSLGLDFEIFEILEDDVSNIIASLISKDELIEEGVWASRDLLSGIRMLPRHLKWFAKEFSKKNYVLEIDLKGQNKSFDKIYNAIIFFGFIFLSSILIYTGSSFLVGNNLTLREIPKITWVFWGASFFFLFRALLSIRK